MKETLELRVDYDYAHLLFKEDEGKNLGDSVRVVKLSKDDPRYEQIPAIMEEVERKFDTRFFGGWNIERKYSRQEFDAAVLLHLKIKKVFEPTGEQFSDDLYDKSVACKLCGANRKQVNLLTLRKSSIPKKDIALTIGGEIVVSRKFADAVNRRNLKGAVFSPINFRSGISDCFYQLTADTEIELSPHTIAGCNPFNFTETSEASESTVRGYTMKWEKEYYKCPEGCTIGLNLLSEPYVVDHPSIKKCDFLASRQKVGVRRGMLIPEPIYFCSQAFKRMVEEEKLTGFQFEVAHVE